MVYPNPLFVNALLQIQNSTMNPAFIIPILLQAETQEYQNVIDTITQAYYDAIASEFKIDQLEQSRYNSWQNLTAKWTQDLFTLPGDLSENFGIWFTNYLQTISNETDDDGLKTFIEGLLFLTEECIHKLNLKLVTIK